MRAAMPDSTTRTIPSTERRVAHLSMRIQMPQPEAGENLQSRIFLSGNGHQEDQASEGRACCDAIAAKAHPISSMRCVQLLKFGAAVQAAGQRPLFRVMVAQPSVTGPALRLELSGVRLTMGCPVARSPRVTTCDEIARRVPRYGRPTPGIHHRASTIPPTPSRGARPLRASPTRP